MTRAAGPRRRAGPPPGGPARPRGQGHRPRRPPAAEPLSRRERELLRRLAEGATSKEIAVVLGLAAKTVENHRARVLGKLGGANSAAAVRAALAHGLIPQMDVSLPA